MRYTIYMKKIIISFGVFLVLVLSAASFSFAQQGGSVTVEVDSNVQAGGSSNTSTSASSSTTATTSAEVTSEEHKRAVDASVKSLLDVAGKHRGIGAQVKVIAQEQKDSNEKTATIMTRIENRSKFKTFLMGSDYKNIGMLRSEMVKTRNQIAKLKALAQKTTTTSVKASLNAQIKVLEEQQVKMESFIKAHESNFSLFGWAAKKDK